MNPETCARAKCEGWTIDEDGMLRACVHCKRYTTDERAAEAAIAFVARFPAETSAGADHPCRGWDIFERSGSMRPGFDINRCDDCAVFADANEALAVATAWFDAQIGAAT